MKLIFDDITPIDPKDIPVPNLCYMLKSTRSGLGVTISCEGFIKTNELMAFKSPKGHNNKVS